MTVAIIVYIFCKGLIFVIAVAAVDDNAYSANQQAIIF
jgi:hypothetical protein